MSKKAFIGAIAFVLIVLSAYFFVKKVVFPIPKNCTVCHFITPFYKKWETSTHNKVPCLKCHDYNVLNAVSGQIRFLAGTYHPRPITRVPDKNCLQSGCHERRLIEAHELFTKRGIDFDHKPHFTESRRGINLHCRSCHSDIVQGEHVRASMNPCFLCHFKGAPVGEAFPGCPSCHSAPKKDIIVKGKVFSHEKLLKMGYKCKQCHVAVTRGDGVVPKERCFFCHVERIEMYEDVEFVHQNHVTKKQIDCLLCHPRIEHGKIEVEVKRQ
ncbi:MAG: hypothetical protein HY805_07910 [Nitrospirae bacterium]|nr:hypothetical protein [Nitrospirota bacterium]